MNFQLSTQPDGVDGPPQVDEIVPAHGAKEIMVTMPVTITFSEPVLNANADTIRLYVFDYDPNTHQTYENPVPAAVYTLIEGGRMRAVLQPRNNLTFGKTYKVVVTTDITDAVSNPSLCPPSTDPDIPLPPLEQCVYQLDREYTAEFTTKNPAIYDLTQPVDTFRDFGYGEVALYTHPDTGRTYAYVAANDKGFYVVNVTDPTQPLVVKSENRSTGVVIWRYRGATVDPQSGILAVTEWIQWMYEGGSQFGYVRFYDIHTNPEAPARIGQERLAEAASGVPDKVVIAGNYAFITTLVVGLQVVDIDAARSYSGLEPGKAIVGGFDTMNLDQCPQPGNPSSNKCGSPSDLALIKNNVALIPTFSGSLLVVDVSTPQFPSLMTSFRPAGYSARRIAAVSEYAFDDADGNNMVLDLAVTSTNFGQGNMNIHTLDVTDPYNPKVLGVVKDSSGNVVNDIFATDIAVSKAAGLVYATTSNAVYVIDIKDPHNPVILNVITQAPNADGTMLPLGYSPAVAEKDGWLYLANSQKGMRVLDLDPVYLNHYCIEEAFCSSYYPALGEKIITLEGRGPDSYDRLLDPSVNPTNPPKVKFIGGTPGITVKSKVAGDENRAVFNNGLAKFYIEPKPGFAEASITLNFEIDLTTIPGGETQLQNSNPNSHKKTVVLQIKDNTKVTVQEVIDGTAVFTADGKESRSTGDKLKEKRFDYMKELLNHVVPRKRTLKFDGLGLPEHLALKPENENNYPYHAKNTGAPLLDEQNTRFDPARDAQNVSENAKRTAQALQIFRKNFGLPNVTRAKTSPTFDKLMVDYNKTTNADKEKWLYQVVDKETLVGSKLNIGPTPDRAIGPETGLYELYENVVKKFIDTMIKEAERYAGIRHAPHEVLPTTDWIARTGEGPATQTNSGHGEGMSYSFGGKQTVEEYNKQTGGGVARNCRIAPSETEKQIVISTTGIEAAKCKACHFINAGANDEKFRYQTFVHIPAVGDDYKGNVKSSSCGLDGSQKYPGLYQLEWNMRGESYKIYDMATNTMTGQTPIFPQFDPGYWAGADCSNLVQKSMLKARTEFTGTGSPKLTFSESSQIWTQSFLEDKIAYQSPLSSTSKMQKWLRKGDLIHYERHISIVHREKSTCSGSDAKTTCTYEIVHAYGRDTVDLGTRDNPMPVFTRKVRVNSNNEPMMPSPTGFGRIKLWD